MLLQKRVPFFLKKNLMEMILGIMLIQLAFTLSMLIDGFAMLSL